MHSTQRSSETQTERIHLAALNNKLCLQCISPFCRQQSTIPNSSSPSHIPISITHPVGLGPFCSSSAFLSPLTFRHGCLSVALLSQPRPLPYLSRPIFPPMSTVCSLTILGFLCSYPLLSLSLSARHICPRRLRSGKPGRAARGATASRCCSAAYAAGDASWRASSPHSLRRRNRNLPGTLKNWNMHGGSSDGEGSFYIDFNGGGC